jgi:hypothetical protein
VDRLVAFQPEKSLDGFRGFLLGEAQIVEALQIVPQPRARAKEMSEAQGGVARYGACSITEVVRHFGWAGSRQIPSLR